MVWFYGVGNIKLALYVHAQKLTIWPTSHAVFSGYLSPKYGVPGRISFKKEWLLWSFMKLFFVNVVPLMVGYFILALTKCTMITRLVKIIFNKICWMSFNSRKEIDFLLFFDIVHFTYFRINLVNRLVNFSLFVKISS